MDKPLRAIPAMIGLGILLAVAHNLVKSDPLPWKTQARAAVDLEELIPGEADGGDSTGSAPDPARGIPESEFPITITLDLAKKLFDTGEVVFYDAREEDEYAEGHIAGAVLAPYDEVGGDVEWLEKAAAAPVPIVIYCGGGDCELSLNLGFAISQAGHRRVLVFEEGYGAWQEAGYPTGHAEAP
jgi:rhodanese-related sulfurtransferase